MGLRVATSAPSAAYPRRSPRARAVVAALSAAAALLFPVIAQACPVCAGRSEGGAVTRGILIGLIIFFPFAVVYAVIRFLRSEFKDGAPGRGGRGARPQDGSPEQGGTPHVQDAFH